MLLTSQARYRCSSAAQPRQPKFGPLTQRWPIRKENVMTGRYLVLRSVGDNELYLHTTPRDRFTAEKKPKS
ncbi:hypothetical protein TNCV_2759521 [Trichonephila clavipes]|nr:hypothetical protein TNCV_2759521 [Trichonephila clavipes]